MARPIIREMCRHYGVTYEDICSQRRTDALVLVRQKIAWVLRKRTHYSYPEIGRKLGGRDHTTILHAERKIDRLIAAGDPRVAELEQWLDG